jgi:glycosyltransferase involved in cell wall biosynthesis
LRPSDRSDEPRRPAGPSTLLVFSDDWGRHPSSCQHLVGELLKAHPVVWFNTIGTRPPRLDRLTLGRGLEKVREWIAPERAAIPAAAVDARGGDAAAPRPTVRSPVMWPRFRRAAERRLNARLLGRAIHGTLTPGERAIGITTLPLVADLIGRVPVERWVYYCVDDLGEWPGLDRETLVAMERRLVERVDDIVVVSDALEQRIRSLGRDATLLTHGVDLDHWGLPAPASTVPPEATVADLRLAALEPPLIVFWGVVDRRLEVDWLDTLARRLERGTLLLVGPRNNPDPRLERTPRLVVEEPLPYRELPRLAAAASVLVMPYADLLATRAMQPLKLKEYLATGLPVVASSLPAVEPWRDACDVVADAGAFADVVARRLESGLPSSQAMARQRLAGESWKRKAEVFEEVLHGKRSALGAGGSRSG